MTANDIRYGRKGGAMVDYHRPTTCIACGGALPPGRFLYCQDSCSLASRQLVWQTRMKDEPLPEALQA